MSTVVQVLRPANFPLRCVRCMAERVAVREFTDTEDVPVAHFIFSATCEIPVCEPCWRASDPWLKSFGYLLIAFFAGGIGLAAISEPGQYSDYALLIMAPLFAALPCWLIGQWRKPVRLQAGKCTAQSLRVKFFNADYAELFVAANQPRCKIINPWKFE